MVVGLRDAVSPAEGDAERLTFPANPLMPWTLIVVVPVCPALKVTVARLVAIVKSTTLTVIMGVV